MNKKLLLFLLIPTFLFAQKSDFKRVKYHSNHNKPMIMVMNDNMKINMLEAKSYLKQILGLANSEDLIEVQRHEDKLGLHIKYNQTIQGSKSKRG